MIKAVNGAVYLPSPLAVPVPSIVGNFGDKINALGVNDYAKPLYKVNPAVYAVLSLSLSMLFGSAESAFILSFP